MNNKRFTGLGLPLATAADILAGTPNLAVPPDQLKLAGVIPALISNLRLVYINSYNLFILTASGGNPSATDAIRIQIPDGSGNTLRSTTSGSIYNASPAIALYNFAYNNTPSGSDINKIHVYAIWSAADQKIIYGFSRYSGFLQVPTTVVVTDSDYMGLEYGASEHSGGLYTRVATDFCVCCGHFWANYNTATSPTNWTIQNSPAGLMPVVEWKIKSDYGTNAILPTSNSQTSDITEYSVMNMVAKQGGMYLLSVSIAAYSNAELFYYIKIGSATYASATYVLSMRNAMAGYNQKERTIEIVVNKGDTVHLGAAVTGSSGNRILIGNDLYPHATGMTMQRIN
jgi:hypothetical protein